MGQVRELRVILDRDMEEADAAPICYAVRLIKGVSEVHFGEQLDVRDFTNRQVAKSELRAAIIEILSPDPQSQR